MKNYKVYLIRNKEKMIVYVGMTSRTLYIRFCEHVSKKIVTHEEHKIELIQDNLSLEEAIALEALMIAQYDTIANGFNKSPKHHTHMEETLKKIRVNRCGMKNSDYQKKCVSEKNSKRLICLNTGKVYNSAREAARDLGLDYCKISMVLNGHRKHTGGYTFRFLPINSL